MTRMLPVLLLLLAACSSTPASVPCDEANTTDCAPCGSDADCPGRACVGGRCVAPGTCAEVTCAEGSLCVRGRCYPRDCGGLACGEDEVCDSQSCRPVDCVGVSCAAGEKCVGGRCYATDCGGCPTGSVCDEGKCVPTDCSGIVCPAEQRCVRGKCWPKTCEVIQCGPQEVCADGCVTEPCLGVRCAAGQVCRDGRCASQGCPCEPSEECLGGSCFMRVGTPVFTAPAAGAVLGASAAVTLGWDAVVGAKSYRVQLYRYASGGWQLVSKVDTAALTLPAGTLAEGFYTAHLWAKGAVRFSDPAKLRFSVFGPAAAPANVKPDDCALAGPSPTLTFALPAGACAARVELYRYDQGRWVLESTLDATGKTSATVNASGAGVYAFTVSAGTPAGWTTVDEGCFRR